MALLALTACAASTPSAKAPITLPPLPGELAVVNRPVPIPVPRPNEKLTQYQVEHYWSTDRGNLKSCFATHGAVTTFYNDLRNEFSLPQN